MFKNFKNGLLPFYCLEDNNAGGENGGTGGGEGGGELGGDTGFVNSDGTFVDGWTDREQFKDNADTLVRFGNVSDLAHSYMDLRKKTSKNPDSLVEIPNANSSDEIKAAWRKANDVPDTTDDYKYELSPELAAKLGPLDDKKIADVKEFAHKELELSPAKFQKLLDFYHTVVANEIDVVSTTLAEQQTRAKEESIAELKKEWLSSYDDKVARANAVMRKYGGDKAVAEFNAENSPAMAKFLDNIAEAMSEDTLKGLKGNSSVTRDGLKSQIAEIRSQMDVIQKEYPATYKGNAKFKDLQEQKRSLYKQFPS